MRIHMPTPRQASGRRRRTLGVCGRGRSGLYDELMDEPILDPDILSFYAGDYDEDVRLRSGIRELELIRTREIIRRYLPSEGLDILDVGGGGGVHAEWLLEDGHNVTLLSDDHGTGCAVGAFL